MTGVFSTVTSKLVWECSRRERGGRAPPTHVFPRDARELVLRRERRRATDTPEGRRTPRVSYEPSASRQIVRSVRPAADDRDSTHRRSRHSPHPTRDPSLLQRFEPCRSSEWGRAADRLDERGGCVQIQECAFARALRARVCACAWGWPTPHSARWLTSRRESVIEWICCQRSCGAKGRVHGGAAARRNRLWHASFDGHRRPETAPLQRVCLRLRALARPAATTRRGEGSSRQEPQPTRETTARRCGGVLLVVGIGRGLHRRRRRRRRCGHQAQQHPLLLHRRLRGGDGARRRRWFRWQAEAQPPRPGCRCAATPKAFPMAFPTASHKAKVAASASSVRGAASSGGGERAAQPGGFSRLEAGHRRRGAAAAAGAHV